MEWALPPELASLTPPEREVLAVLAVMGGVALSPEQLAALTTVADPRPILASLERQGFVEREDDRYRIARDREERLREAWNVVDTGDRVLRQLISIAQDGRLTWSDLDAVLGVSQWACEVGRFQELLRLVKTVRTTVDIVRRVEAWITILQRARQAARALGDLDAEAWVERELAACARIQADEPRARAHEEREQSLRRSATPRRGPALRGPRWLLQAAATAAAAGVGLAVGFAIFHSPSPSLGAKTVTAPGTTIRLRPRTTTIAGTTVTLPGTITTIPGTTVTVSGAVTTVTTTVTTTVSPPPPPIK
jgi:DNA-binding MarR family transcriptional regulator